MYINCWIPISEISGLELEDLCCRLPFFLTHIIVSPKLYRSAVATWLAVAISENTWMIWLHFNTFYEVILLRFSSQSCVWKGLKAFFLFVRAAYPADRLQSCCLWSTHHPKRQSSLPKVSKLFQSTFSRVSQILLPSECVVLTTSGNYCRGSHWWTALGLINTACLGMWGQYGAVGESQGQA